MSHPPSSDALAAGARAEAARAEAARAEAAAADTGTPDVLVAGGGVIGLAVAWRAAQRGLRVTVADPAPGTGATRAAAGMLTPVAEAAYAERELFRLGSASLQRYPAFAAELTALTGLPTGFRQTGTLQVGYDSDDVAVLAEQQRLQESFGHAATRLTARQCREAEPMLGPSVHGGLLAPGDGSADPRLLAAALLAAVRQAGGSVVRDRVAELITSGGAVTAARLGSGQVIRAGQVVLAAGWQTAAIGGLPPGTAPPVRPVKGQILRLRPVGSRGAAGTRDDAGGPLLSRTVRGVVRGSSVYLVPRADGELVVGATQEDLGPDTTVTAGGVWELLRDARLLVPGITELELAEATAGLRPGTPDNAPVIGPAAAAGLVLATGHFRGGVLLAPVTGDLVAEYLATGRVPELARPFTAGRFAGGAATGSQATGSQATGAGAGR